jgi:hypothetical protein
MIDLRGKRIGKLTVLQRVKNKNRRVRWKCKCDCGTTKIIWANNLHTKLSKSCGCSKARKGKENPTWKGYGDISSRQFSAIKKGAENRGLEFSISIIELWRLFLKQNKKCSLSHIPLSFSRSNLTASLDRINNQKGYIQGNIQWVHVDVNFMKQDLSQDEFIQYCNLISKVYESKS